MARERVLRQAGLKQGLHGWMIFFIIISSVIGSGIFSNGGTAMKVAGPAGALVALLIMSIIAICVSECISELTQLFSVPNAIVEFVRKFVDEDFGWAIGIIYWLTYASIFAAQNMTAFHLSEYWGQPGPASESYRTAGFYFGAPIIMFGINTAGVKYFGWVEAVGGILKILLVAMTTLLLWIMAGSKLQAGFQYNKEFAKSNAAAICYVIPILAFGFVGLEAIAVTAFEAAPKSLHRPSRIIACIASSMYLLCMLSQYLNVPWDTPKLPDAYSGIGKITGRADDSLENSNSDILAIMAIEIWKKNPLNSVLNGAIIFSVLSASNTSLYIASRTLYGMALRVQDNSILGKAAHAFAKVDPKTGVPLRALFLSWVSFIWVPFLSLGDSGKLQVQHIIEIIQVASSVGCIIVWAALTLAYLQYWNRQRKYDIQLENSNDYLRFRRDAAEYGAHTILMSLQPVPALVAFVGCMAIFAFCSATWWFSDPTAPKFFMAYAAQVMVLIIFAVLKAIRYSRTGSIWAAKATAFSGFSESLDDLVRLIRKPPVRSIPLVHQEPPNSTTNNEAAQTGFSTIPAVSRPVQAHIAST